MRKSRKIMLGSTPIGGGEPPVLQSMITTPLTSPEKALEECMNAHEMGLKVMRTAFKNMDETDGLKYLVENFPGEIIADIHFDYGLALAAIEAGVSGIRINPGNIGGKERVREVVEAAKKRKNLALRIGVNGGSLEKEIVEKYNGVTTEGLVESTKNWVDYIESDLGFNNFKISVKHNSVRKTVDSCRLVSQFTDAPLHVGITEAGAGIQGTVKAAMGIGILLEEGLVDTFRVSLTAPVEEEIKVGMQILKSYGILQQGGEIISCPTCGRTHGELFRYYRKLENWFTEKRWWLRPALKVALMGCEVNGPGEAREADLGIALGKNGALYFENGSAVKRFDDRETAFNFMLEKIEKKWN